MIEIIAHRARFDYPDKKRNPNSMYGYDERDNTIAAIDVCLNEGYKVELDVSSYKSSVNEVGFMLSHDMDGGSQFDDFETQAYDIDQFYLHAKDRRSLNLLAQTDKDYLWFVQDKDDYTPIINSSGLIWAHPQTFDKLWDTKWCKEDVSNVIMCLNERVIPNRDQLKFLGRFWGVCTDFPHLYKTLLRTYA